jgi:hypothetical protein
VAKVFILYERERDPERYAAHVDEYAVKVPGATFRHERLLAILSASPSSATTRSSSSRTSVRAEDQNPWKFRKPTPGLEPGTPFTSYGRLSLRVTSSRLRPLVAREILWTRNDSR